MRKNILWLAAIMLAACSGNRQETEVNDNDSVEVKTAGDTTEIADSAETGEVDAVTSATNVEKAPTFNGVIIVAPQQKATLSLTMGGKIHSLTLMPGQAVRRGQVVATIDNPEYIELQQSYLESAAQLEYLEKEYARQKALGEKDAASQKKVQQSKADYLSMHSRMTAAASRLHALGVSTKELKASGIKAYLPVVAPIGGYVTNLTANLGTYLDAGEPICDIINKAQPLLELTVYEKDIKMMRTGAPVQFRVNGYGKQTFHATIVSIDQTVNEKDYSIKVYARIKDSISGFRPGMYVRARVYGN